VLQRDVVDTPVPRDARVTVVLPTIERYPYLRQLLPQLAAQTHPVAEIVIVDQTPKQERDLMLAADFPALPIEIIYQEQPGQCTARNQAIQRATGNFILFLDDDDEVDPTLTERHLRNLARYAAEVSCGTSDEVGIGTIHRGPVRASDVFSTNNSMVRAEVLRSSGLFDLAYDCKQNEDGDLGIRIHLAGALMVLDPSIKVLHHRAPRGGLRIHGARVVTYASSRQRITHRNLPNMSEVYMGMRYFSARQVREMLVLRTWGTMSSKAGGVRKGLKAMYALAALPDTMYRVRKARDGARRLLESFPQIERLR
jgi:glycosyltransferase involved in cell wall biosynthesis